MKRQEKNRKEKKKEAKGKSYTKIIEENIIYMRQMRKMQEERGNCEIIMNKKAKKS